MIKLAPLLKEIEVMRPFNGRITNEHELEQYLNFLERKEGEEIYNISWNRGNIIGSYNNSNNYTSIPENIKSLYNLKYVEGALSLIGCKNIISLPNNLTVTNNLYIQHSNISEIPNNLNIGGNLLCRDTPLLKKYSTREIKQLIIDKGGSVKKVLR
jgi:hypothetical protein